jgi:hypothetical protein
MCQKTEEFRVTDVPLGLDCRPFGALLVMEALSQGLTPLANN